MKEYRENTEKVFLAAIIACEHALTANVNVTAWENMRTLYKKGLEVLKTTGDDKLLEEMQDVISLLTEAKKLL